MVCVSSYIEWGIMVPGLLLAHILKWGNVVPGLVIAHWMEQYCTMVCVWYKCLLQLIELGNTVPGSTATRPMLHYYIKASCVFPHILNEAVLYQGLGLLFFMNEVVCQLIYEMQYSTRAFIQIHVIQMTICTQATRILKRQYCIKVCIKSFNKWDHIVLGLASTYIVRQYCTWANFSLTFWFMV